VITCYNNCNDIKEAAWAAHGLVTVHPIHNMFNA